MEKLLCTKCCLFLSLQLVMEYCLGSASDLIEGKLMKNQAIIFFFLFALTDPEPPHPTPPPLPWLLMNT